MNILVVNFGNPREIADKFGPLLGTLLELEEFEHNIKIVGTCTEPVHTLRQYNELQGMINSDEWDYVITTDAAMSHNHDFNKLFVKEGGVHPGRGTAKKDKTTYQGDIGILYCVGENPLEIGPTDKMVSMAALKAVSKIHDIIAVLQEDNIVVI